MSPPQPDSGEDQWTWGEEKNGKFSIKSAYNLIHDLPGIQTTETWRSVWRWKGPISDIAWEPGPSDWWVLNTDGSFNSTRGKATAGGLLRDRAGQCLFAFTSNLGSCSITRAEIRGAIQGLQLAWGKGFKKVILRMDSQAAISILTDEASPEHQHGLEVLIFREMCSRNWSVKIEHTYREGNYAADHLAALGYDYPIGNHMVSTTCNSLVYFLRRDCIGVSEPRSILIND
ncbi:Putative ribonuclease H protein At1g65750 [Linum perenne]